MRVLIVDDEPDIRLLARTVLEKADGFEVVGEASSGADGLEKVRALKPEVVVLDQRLPDMAGVEVARQVRADGSEAVIVLFAAHVDDEIRAGASETRIAAIVGKNEVLDLPRLLALAAGDQP